MCYFENINSSNIEQYFSQIAFLFMRYKNFLVDDYAQTQDFGEFLYDFIMIRLPFFWVILDKKYGEFAGFVFLDNITGCGDNLHTAEITTCFDKKFWGDFTYDTARIFLTYCFSEIDFKKIKAKIYPENNRVRSILNKCKFKFEGYLPFETMHLGKLQDIEVYGLLNPKYRKEIL